MSVRGFYTKDGKVRPISRKSNHVGSFQNKTVHLGNKKSVSNTSPSPQLKNALGQLDADPEYLSDKQKLILYKEISKIKTWNDLSDRAKKNLQETSNDTIEFEEGEHPFAGMSAKDIFENVKDQMSSDLDYLNEPQWYAVKSILEK